MPTRPTTKRVVKRDPESGFFAFIWRARVGLAPPLYGFAVYVLALVLRYIIQLDTQMFAITAGIASFVAFLFIRFANPDRDGSWHSKLNQMYLYSVTLATSIWGYWFQSLPHDVASLKLGS